MNFGVLSSISINFRRASRAYKVTAEGTHYKIRKVLAHFYVSLKFFAPLCAQKLLLTDFPIKLEKFRRAARAKIFYARFWRTGDPPLTPP